MAAYPGNGKGLGLTFDFRLGGKGEWARFHGQEGDGELGVV